MTRIAISLTALIFAASCFGAAAQDPAPAPVAEAQFELPADPDALVVRYQQVIGKLEDPDPGPSVAVFSSGRVRVHYPRYMKKAGDYEMFLGRDQVADLVASLIDRGLPEVDPGQVAEEVAADPAPRVWTSDSSTTVIELRLEEYRPAGAAEEEPVDLRREVRWTNLGFEAEHHPGVKSLQGLAEAERELRSLMEHDDLRRIDD